MKLTPIKQLSLADIAAIEASIKERLLDEASRRLARPKEQLVIRDILPKTDLGLTNEEWVTPSLTANAWTKYFDIKLPDTRFICFYGAANNAADPIVTAVMLKMGPAGATTRGSMELEEIYADEVPVGILDEAVLYRGGDHIYVDCWAKKAGTEPLVLKGMVAEPYGEVVSG